MPEPTRRIDVDWEFPGPVAYWAAEGVAMPARFSAQVDDPALPYTLALDFEIDKGRPACIRMEARQRPGGPPLTNASLRPPIGKLTAEVASLVMFQATEAAGEVSLEPGVTEDQIGALQGRFRKSGRPTRQPRQSARDQVVDRYRHYLAMADPSPRRSTARELGYAESYVGRLLVEARKAGLLGPAAPGRAIEIPPPKRKARRKP